MFDKILIANRGEIACRVARTARRMGIRTVAVYSDADADALHVAACDEGYRLGPPPPRESYLNGDAIIAIANKTGAQAIHPGYGFLSENELFAAACVRAGIAFIGPPPAAIAAMGSKSAAKRIMGGAKVPLVPGYHGDDQAPKLLAREAAKIGYPVLIKATAGGGGKGMKVVESAKEFAAALASAQREAQAGFGDDRVLIEKYLTAPRHIEIQVFADTHGNAVYLFERDCSVQRRHQKVLEEAPAPGMKPAQRRAMGEAAVAAAKAIGYVGAGTVEFIAADTFARDGAFYFMEMNTRLQVEHPVTEMITGEDLVEWQLRVASGEKLPKRQDELAIDGHAIEARIYAEDPERGFLPSIGTLTHFRMPATDAAVRVDTGVRAGDEISPFYDPMIAKLIVHGEDRAAALRRLAEALAGCEIVGVATNVAFLQRVVAHEAFASGNVDTGLIARNHAALFPAATPAPPEVLLAGALAEVRTIVATRAATAKRSEDPYSPWHAVDPWWPNSASHGIALAFADGEARHAIAVRCDGDGWRVRLPSGETLAHATPHDGRVTIASDAAEYCATVVPEGEERHVFCNGGHYKLLLVDPLAHAGEEEAHGGHLMAPMSGTVVAVMVKAGDKVGKGAPLMILEAMKMEHTIAAPSAGVVTAVNYRAGDRVKEGADLVDIEDAGARGARVKVLLQVPGRAVEEWRMALASALPAADIAVWPDAPADPEYALVWRPPAELFLRIRPGKAIFNLGAGVDALMALPTLPAEVPIIRIEDAGMAEQMAEYVTEAVLRAYREMDFYATQQRGGRWQQRRRLPKAEFGVGILGFGVLGQAIAPALATFGFPLAGWSRSRKMVAGVECFAGRDELPVFLARSRVLVCLLPSTRETSGFLDRAMLGRLPQGAHVINIARGELVVDADLVALLDSGHLAGATLDVFRTEPLPADHAFWHHPRITVTPHTSAVTLVADSIAQVAAKIREIEQGRPVTGVVDRARGY